MHTGAIGGGEIFGDSQKNAVLGGVYCNGTEENLLSCVFNISGSDVDECGASEDAHVVCQC